MTWVDNESTTPKVESEKTSSDSWITKRLLSVYGPADTTPMGADPDSSGYGARLCPQCNQPFEVHEYDRSSETSRIYCPVAS